MSLRLIIVFFLSALAVALSYWLYGKRERKRLQAAPVERDPNVAREKFLGHRARLLAAMPEQFKIKTKQFQGEVWGVVMERGLTNGSTTFLEVLADGTTNLRYSNGVRIGLKSDHPRLNKLRSNLLTIADAMRDETVPHVDTPLPIEGKVHFFILTRNVARLYASTVERLQSGSDDFSGLYFAGCAIENEWYKMVSPD